MNNKRLLSALFNLRYQFVIWILLWAIVWGLRTLFFGTESYPLYVLHYVAHSSLMFAGTVFAFLVWREHLLKLLRGFQFLPIGILVIFFTSNALLCIFSSQIIDSSGWSYLLTYQCLAARFFEILFQQIMIVSLVALLAHAGLSLGRIVQVSACFFVTIHFALFFFSPFVYATFYTIGSLVAAVTFSLLILRVRYGFIYTYILHYWGFYIICAVIA